MDSISSDKAVTRSKEKVLKQRKLFEKMQEKFAARLGSESYKEMKVLLLLILSSLVLIYLYNRLKEVTCPSVLIEMILLILSRKTNF